MSAYIVTVKPGADKDQLMEEVKAAGGTITHNYTLIPAFAVSFPKNHVQAFAEHKSVQSMEPDGVVKTQ